MFKKNSVTRDIPVIAEYDGAYITDWKVNGITYTWDIEYAHVFKNPDEARKLIPEGFQYGTRLLDAKLKDAPVYCVYEFRKHCGFYVRKVNHSKHKIEFTDESKYALKFRTEKAARNWCEKYAARTTGCAWTVTRIK